MQRSEEKPRSLGRSWASAIQFVGGLPFVGRPVWFWIQTVYRPDFFLTTVVLMKVHEQNVGD